MQKSIINTSSLKTYTEDEQQKIVYLLLHGWEEIYVCDVHYWVAPTTLKNTWHQLKLAYAFQKFLETADIGDDY